jgi:hypothetical protein
VRKLPGSPPAGFSPPLEPLGPSLAGPAPSRVPVRPFWSSRRALSSSRWGGSPRCTSAPLSATMPPVRRKPRKALIPRLPAPRGGSFYLRTPSSRPFAHLWNCSGVSVESHVEFVGDPRGRLREKREQLRLQSHRSFSPSHGCGYSCRTSLRLPAYPPSPSIRPHRLFLRKLLPCKGIRALGAAFSTIHPPLYEDEDKYTS